MLKLFVKQPLASPSFVVVTMPMLVPCIDHAAPHWGFRKVQIKFFCIRPNRERSPHQVFVRSPKSTTARPNGSALPVWPTNNRDNTINHSFLIMPANNTPNHDHCDRITTETFRSIGVAVTKKSTVDSFAAHFMTNPTTCFKIWQILQSSEFATDAPGLLPEHILWTLAFMKMYSSDCEKVISSMFSVDEKCFAHWVEVVINMMVKNVERLVSLALTQFQNLLSAIAPHVTSQCVKDFLGKQALTATQLIQL